MIILVDSSTARSERFNPLFLAMRLSLHTDFSLRVLMYLAALPSDELTGTPALAERFNVSANHLQKVVQTLRKLSLVETWKGNGGGIRLAVDPTTIRLGNLIRSLESSGELVDCTNGPCPLQSACVLKVALDDAETHFFERLNLRTLADTLRPPMRQQLAILHRA